MKTVSEFLKSLCLLASVFALVEAGLAFHELRGVSISASETITEAHGAVAELRKAASAVSEYSQVQIRQLRDPRNQKALEAGLQALAVFNGSGRLINRQVIPRAMRVLDNLSNAAASLDKAIQTTDRSVNDELLQESKLLLASTTGAVTAAQKSAEAASSQFIQIGNDIHSILSDPALKLILTETNGIAAHADGVAANLEEASKRMPLIAADLERIAATSSRYRKAVLLSQILSALGRAFF